MNQELLAHLVEYFHKLKLPADAEGEGKSFALKHSDPAAWGYLLAAICSLHKGKNIWLIHSLPRMRERIAMEMQTWNFSPLLLPDASPENDDGTLNDPAQEAERLHVLQQLCSNKKQIVFTAVENFSSPAPSPEAIKQSNHAIHVGQEIAPNDFTTALTQAGYEYATIVHTRGTYTARGGIIDVFPWHAAAPLRIEFFDREIESLRSYDPDSQLSTEKLTSAQLTLSEPEKNATLLDYVAEDDVVILLDEEIHGQSELHQIDQFTEGRDGSPSRPNRITLGGRLGEPSLPFSFIHFSPDVSDELLENEISLPCHAQPLGIFEAGDFILQEKKREAFFQQLQEWKTEKWHIAMTFANDGEQERFTELAGDISLLTPLRGELHSSFTIPSLKIAVLSSSEIFGRYRSPSLTKKSLLEKHNAARTSLDEIQLADLVVHYEYGIGRFRGIHRSDEGEEIAIEYRDGAMLSVPIEQAHLLAKYVGLGGKTPELNKLGGVSWKTTRKSAEKSIIDYAAQILRVQAERSSRSGYTHPPDSRWMWEFENSFHFTETADQRRAIEEAKRDMESNKPMDRLVCGDVGFGKTEVAIRAAFKAATGGKQTAILCPTTVLAEQHWRTFRERMSDYPIRIDLLNRFRTPSEIRETIRGVADGSVDIVIGTHRLLSGDVVYKDLGLVVVDEEQRFGVKHKEKFKDIFRSIDILTLSATPIPRTLYMALMGARDMSTIDTPPPNRTPVQTTVAAYDDRIIREAIKREMKRGGQTFFLHNRVKTIETMRKKIQDLVPEARILVGHGQMEQDELEVVMKKFVNAEADVLLATTIIETGIDIPNANTILIDRADRFGLADLYQLRGRVGRAGEKAYAILLLPRDIMAQGDARKRINAIKQYTALGSGFKIAMRDLEIRGAGNLLGTKQSGHIAAVGFDLYCQLLRQSIDRLKGNIPAIRPECTLKSDFIELVERPKIEKHELPCYLPNDYITEIRLRVSAYRELAECLTEKHLDALTAQWSDRFGKLPTSVKNLLNCTRIKIRAAAKKITQVEFNEQRLILTRNGSPILLENRHPRLKTTKPEAKISEALKLLEIL